MQSVESETRVTSTTTRLQDPTIILSIPLFLVSYGNLDLPSFSYIQEVEEIQVLVQIWRHRPVVTTDDVALHLPEVESSDYTSKVQSLISLPKRVHIRSSHVLT